MPQTPILSMRMTLVVLMIAVMMTVGSFIFLTTDGTVQPPYLRNELDFWKVHGIMSTSGLLQSNFARDPEVFMIP